MDNIETWIAILTLFGAREVVSSLINRRKTRADVRATDASAAGEIAGAAGDVVKLLRTEIELVKGQREDFKVAYEETLEKFKDSEAFKAILEAQMKYVNDMRADLESIIDAMRNEAVSQKREMSELRARIEKCHEALLVVKDLEQMIGVQSQTIKRQALHIADLQDAGKSGVA